VRHSRKQCSPAGEAWGGGGRGAMSGSARSGDVGLGCVGSGVMGSIGRCEVGRVARGRTGGVGGAGARVGFSWTIGPLGPGDIGHRYSSPRVMDQRSITWTQPTDRSIEPGPPRACPLCVLPARPARAAQPLMPRPRGSAVHGHDQAMSRLPPALPRD
jgi:hypothetical protein